MKLTGKAKEILQLWYLKSIDNDKYVVSRFFDIPEAMQWGVYQDWADSLGYELCIDRCVDDECNYVSDFEWVVITINTISNNGSGGTCSTRQEARNAAIEKLNEIINKG